MGWKTDNLFMAALFCAMLAFAGCMQVQSIAGQQPVAGQAQGQQGASYCSGMSGDRLIQCIYGRAKSTSDVTACTSLGAQADRNICIAQWCGSEARDYTQCSRLSNYDDNLGCLSKCNPNPNT